MRFIIIALFAFLPLNAMADDSAFATVGDIDELFELIETTRVAGNSCSAQNLDTGVTCSVACPDTLIAYCRDVTSGTPICECQRNPWERETSSRSAFGSLR